MYKYIIASAALGILIFFLNEKDVVNPCDLVSKQELHVFDETIVNGYYFPPAGRNENEYFSCVWGRGDGKDSLHLFWFLNSDMDARRALDIFMDGRDFEKVYMEGGIATIVKEGDQKEELFLLAFDTSKGAMILKSWEMPGQGSEKLESLQHISSLFASRI